MTRSTYLIALLALQSIVFSGCVVGPSPSLPATWVKHSDYVQTITTTTTHQAKLQVFVAYSGMASSHSALRLVASNGQAIFWDPAGDYGQFDDDWYDQYGHQFENVNRVNDLIIDNAPDMKTIIRWRWTIDDTSVEVFEWDLSKTQAQKLREVLLNGTGDDHPAGSFSSWTPPFFCTMATSDFLSRFASPMIQLPKRYFFPHNLAKALYSQSPSRVRVFTWDGKKAIYAPPGPTSVRQ